MTNNSQPQYSVHDLVDLGNNARENNQPFMALQYYTAAVSADQNNSAALNNLGNVWREVGEPGVGKEFLLRALEVEPTSSVANFNLAVAYLLGGDYEHGWTQYEKRWNFEHLAGTLPQFSQPRWTGQDLKDKTILITGEQGHGDTIQFVRFAKDLHDRGARIKLQCTLPVIPLLQGKMKIEQFYRFDETPTDFDYWTPIMSIPGILGITLDNLELHQQYIVPDPTKVKDWFERLGPKRRMRIGFCWSGRPDAWLNRHKSIPFETMFEFVRQHPEHEWISLQVAATPEQNQQLESIGVRVFKEELQDFSDTAALMNHLDVVISVDTSVAHLAGALGRPTWILLQWFALDWRWLLKRKDSPWYKTAKLFRQPGMGDWGSVLRDVDKFLGWFKI